MNWNLAYKIFSYVCAFAFIASGLMVIYWQRGIANPWIGTSACIAAVASFVQGIFFIPYFNKKEEGKHD